MTPETLLRWHRRRVAHLRLLDGMVMKQATMLAFERLFLLFGVALLSALPLLLLMKRGHFSRRDDEAVPH